MYPPNVLVAPRLLDCVPPYVNSPFTSYIPPPVSLCLPPPAPSHLPPPPTPHTLVFGPEVQVLAGAEQLCPHTREVVCVASQHYVHHSVTLVFFSLSFIPFVSCQKSCQRVKHSVHVPGMDYKNWILDL